MPVDKHPYAAIAGAVIGGVTAVDRGAEKEYQSEKAIADTKEYNKGAKESNWAKAYFQNPHMGLKAERELPQEYRQNMARDFIGGALSGAQTGMGIASMMPSAGGSGPQMPAEGPIRQDDPTFLENADKYGTGKNASGFYLKSETPMQVGPTVDNAQMGYSLDDGPSQADYQKMTSDEYWETPEQRAAFKREERADRADKSWMNEKDAFYKGTGLKAGRQR